MKVFKVPAITISKYFVLIKAVNKDDAFKKALGTRKKFTCYHESELELIYDDIRELIIKEK